jgi:hypothetical protein
MEEVEAHWVRVRHLLFLGNPQHQSLIELPGLLPALRNRVQINLAHQLPLLPSSSFLKILAAMISLSASTSKKGSIPNMKAFFQPT